MASNVTMRVLRHDNSYANIHRRGRGKRRVSEDVAIVAATASVATRSPIVVLRKDSASSMRRVEMQI